MHGRMLFLAAALLVGVGNTCRAGDTCGSCGVVATCGDCCETANSPGLLRRLHYRNQCEVSCMPTCCSGPQGYLNRRHAQRCGDCCEAECGKGHVRKFLEWLCYRPTRQHCGKGHRPCCDPPLYTFFLCCDGEGCGRCHGTCSTGSPCSSWGGCSSCGK